jgi:hypothetical protein
MVPKGAYMPHDEIGVADALEVSMGRNRAFDDHFTITGRVELVLRDKLGRFKARRVINNLVVTAGKNHIADQLSSAPGGSAMSHMAVGTGSTAPAAGDTTLGTEIDRNALTSRTDATNVVTYVGDWAAGDATNSAIAEAGIFNASSAGTMLARATFTAINKGASDTLKITWTVTIG